VTYGKSEVRGYLQTAKVTHIWLQGFTKSSLGPSYGSSLVCGRAFPAKFDFVDPTAKTDQRPTKPLCRDCEEKVNLLLDMVQSFDFLEMQPLLPKMRTPRAGWGGV